MAIDRTTIWPDFRAADILFEDEWILVVNKPAYVPSQAKEAFERDDLKSRVERFIEARDGRAPYIGVHQRLDKETSGVVLFTKSKEANGPIAAQFEKRTIKKEYAACVEGWKGPSRTLNDQLEPGDRGAMRIAKRRTAHSQNAVTRVEVIEKKERRALLRLFLETGRTHQARVQLAGAGAPIAGDAIYDGPSAPRLLLHARAIDLLHPKTNRPLRVESPLPPEFHEWLQHGDLGDQVFADSKRVRRALTHAIEKRWLLGRSEAPRKTTAFRLVNDRGDGLPGVTIDVYGDHLLVQLYEEGGPRALADRDVRDRLFNEINALGFEGLYLKVRPKQANTLVDPKRDDIAPKEPVRGSRASDEFEIVEEGVTFPVRLGDGLSTGIFLDQRRNRRLVGELSPGKSVANLFAYTSAFSVVAAVNRAAKTVSVDASPLALERGRNAMKALGILSDAHRFVAEDAFAWLARMKKKGETFDLLILDPPSYSTTKKRRWVSSSDYAELAAEALAVIAPGGKLLACSNHRGIGHAKFRRFMFEAATLAGRTVTQVKDLQRPEDFPVAIGAESHLKCVLVTLAD